MNWHNFVEIEDKKWFPQMLRNQITDALRYLIIDLKVYDPIIPEFMWVMQKSKTKKVVDLCSGGTGPWQYLADTIRKLEESVDRVTLTDLYPHQEALKTLAEHHALFDYRTESVNALNINEDLEGVRTLFSCFHHFDRAQATSIIQDAVNKQMPICIFEFTERRMVNLLLSPISTVILFTKLLFNQPLNIQKLVFCYLLPIVPLVYLWDSTLSHLSSYSQDELRAIIKSVYNNESFTWEVGESSSPRTPLKNIFLIGYPQKQ